MTRLMERALEAVRDLPADAQDDIARIVLALAGVEDLEPVALSPEERAAIARSRAAATKGDFASDEQVRLVWEKYGL